MDLVNFKNRFKNCDKFIAIHESEDGSFTYRINGTSLTIKREKFLIYYKPRTVGATAYWKSPNSSYEFRTKFYILRQETSFEDFLSSLSRIDEKAALELIYNLTELL